MSLDRTEQAVFVCSVLARLQLGGGAARFQSGMGTTICTGSQMASVFPSSEYVMTLVLRLVTLITIATAGFALPMTCAQGEVTAATQIAPLALTAIQPSDPAATATEHLTEQAHTTHPAMERLLDTAPGDCGDNASRVVEHPATFDTQPFTPGYLGVAPVLRGERPAAIELPSEPIPIGNDTGPPEAPPPKSID